MSKGSLFIPVLLCMILAGCGGGGGSSAPASASLGSTASSVAAVPATLSATATSSAVASTPATSTSTSTPAPAPTATPTSTPTTVATPSPVATPTPAPVPSTTSAGGPFTSASLWVDPSSEAVAQVAAWKTSRPADATQIQKIASQPWAKWISGGTTAIPAGDVAWLNARFQEGAVPFVVLYSIPSRDTGGLASGGQATASAYQSWVASFAAAVGTHRVIVVLEPDALPQISNLSAADQATRYALIKGAVTALKALPNTTVYLDAGNPLWVSVSDMAPRLAQAGIAQADGFSLNISNFCYTNTCYTYGDALSSMVGGKHFVIDTSRNGVGPTADGQWCNPAGRALGAKPLTPPTDSLCDALLWIKAPGYSDGACNGGPSWGWWADYALGLAQRASW